MLRTIPVIINPMAKYSEATMNAYGEVVNPNNVICSVVSDSFLSLLEAEAQYKNFCLTRENEVVYQLFHFQRNSGDKLSKEISISKINVALKEYKTSQGWI